MRQKISELNRRIDERTSTGSRRKDWAIALLILGLAFTAFNTLGSTNLDTPVDHDHYTVTDQNIGDVYRFEDYTFVFKDRYSEDMDNGSRIGYTDKQGNVALATGLTARQTYSTCTHELKHNEYKAVPHIRFDNPLGDGKIRLFEGWFDRPVYSDVCLQLMMSLDKNYIEHN